MAKSTPYMLMTARKIVIDLDASDAGMTMATISDAQPRERRQKHTITAPPTMYGLLRPQLDLDLSDKVPTIGCIISPERGPAIQTKDTLLFVSPRLRRKGVQ
jgi:hypothetical protein